MIENFSCNNDYTLEDERALLRPLQRNEGVFILLLAIG